MPSIGATTMLPRWSFVHSWVKEIDIWAFLVCMLMLSGKEGDPVLVIRLSVCIHGTPHVATYFDSGNQAGRCSMNWIASDERQTQAFELHAKFSSKGLTLHSIVAVLPGTTQLQLSVLAATRVTYANQAE